jgi:hypothetical protein
VAVHQHYLRDLGYMLRERALDAREQAKTSKADYDRGRRMVYYEVVSLMEQQAVAFDMPLADLAFDGFDADRDLL